VVLSTVAVVAPLALRLPPVRRIVIAKVNGLLESTFAGKVAVDRIGALGLTYVDGVDAHVDGTDGKEVLRVEGMRARVSTWTLVRSALGTRGEIVVDVPELSFARVEAALDPDEGGALRIARAFELRPDATPAGAPHRAVLVALAQVLVSHATVHVNPKAAPPLDADVDGARASLYLAGGRLTIDLGPAPLVVRGLPGGVQAEGQVEAHLTQPSLRVRALWNGAIGTIGDRAEVTYDDGHLDATIDVARATPEEMRAAWPECPISVETEAHAEAHGTLPHLDVSAHVTAGTAALDVGGPVVVRPEVHAALHFEALGLDAHAVVPWAPRSNVAASGDVDVTAKPSGALEGSGTLLVSGGTWGSTLVPPATLAGRFGRSADGQTSAQAEATIREPGALSTLTMQLEPRGGSRVLTFVGDVEAARLESVAPLAHRAAGSASVHAAGAIDLGAKTVDARVSAVMANLIVLGASVQRARVDGHATGKLEAPSIDVAIDGEGLERGIVHLPALRAQGRLTIDGGLAAHDVRVDVSADGEAARAQSSLVRLSGETLRADDVEIDGLGSELTAMLMVSPSAVVVKAKSDGLDLARIAVFANVPAARGKLALDVDATVSRGSAHGRVAFDLEHAAFSEIKDAGVRIDATIDGRHASGRVTANVEDIGTIEFHSSSVNVGSGPLLTASPWRKAWGTVDLDARMDLARLAARLPPNTLRLATVLGTLELRGQVTRETDDDLTPDVEIAARTIGLVLANGSGPTRPDGKAGAGAIPAGSRPWRVAGIDPTLRVTVNGNTGETALQAQLRDSAGTMITLDAESREVPYAVLLSDASPVEALRAMPFDARIAVPSRRLDSLLSGWGFGAVAGDIQASASWHGSALHPTVDATASLVGGNLDPAVMALPLDIAVGAHYDGTRIDGTVRATSRRQQVLEASATVIARARDLLAGLSGAGIPWTASARAKLDRLPLRSIAFLDDGQVRGKVSGQISLEGLHEDARASLALDFDGLEVGGVPCRSSSVKATTDGRVLDASARVDQKDGFMEATARIGVLWGKANAPSLDVSRTAEASLTAKQFRAAFLLPFASRWMSELDGRVDADLHAQLPAGGATVRPEGAVTLQDGTFELASFGGAFHGASAKVLLTPDGVVRLQDALAQGVRGSLRAAASARFDGLTMAGARAALRIPAKDALPLVFDGVQMGMLDGDFDVAVDRVGANGGLAVLVDVPAAHVELPSGPSSMDVQSLGGLAGVKVGLRPGAGAFVEAPLDGTQAGVADRTGGPRTAVEIAIRLHDMRVSRGTDLDVRFEGQPTISVADETRVAGQIRMLRGSIDVLGKPFAIDQGTVTFVGGDSTNPQIVLSASWTAPDLTRIYADFVGPLKTGKVKLRSEPSKSQSEIVALVLFGATDEQSGTPMAAAASGAATQPLNRALGGVDRALESMGMAGGITTKIDTSQTTPRPEVEVQIARDISVQIAWVLGAIPPGTNPDSALVTLNWHFLRKWSLETTVGDQGTSIVDVVWQHRY